MNKSGFLQKIQFFPLPMFAVIMGLSGLAIVLERSVSILGFHPMIAWSVTLLDTVLFVVILSLYALKTMLFFDEFKKDFFHRIRISFFAAISISTMLLSIVYHGYNKDVAYYLAIVGVGLHAIFTFYTISFWFDKNYEIKHSNPAWFIPIVGNVVAPIAGVGFFPTELLMGFFAVGMFFWVVIFAVMFNRIVFHDQLPQKFMPTLFILIAPPAVGFIAYIKMTQSYDFFAHALYDLGLFFFILVIVMWKNFIKLKFFISWWAFTFPLAAMTIASLLSYKISGIFFYKIISYVLIGTTLAVVFIVAWQTIKHMLRGEICIQED